MEIILKLISTPNGETEIIAYLGRDRYPFRFNGVFPSYLGAYSKLCEMFKLQCLNVDEFLLLEEEDF